MSKLWNVVSEITHELSKQLDEGTAGFVHEDNGVAWAVTREYSEEEKEKQASDKASKLRLFFRKRDEGYVLKALNIQINKYKEDKGATLFVSTTLNDKSKNITIPLSWTDNLRPTMFKLRNLIKRTHFALLEQNALGLDKHLAEIIPNRIDTILLGDGKDEGTS